MPYRFSNENFEQELEQTRIDNEKKLYKSNCTDCGRELIWEHGHPLKEFDGKPYCDEHYKTKVWTPEIELPYTFDLVLDIKTYGQLTDHYRRAKQEIQDIEQICKSHGVPIPEI